MGDVPLVSLWGVGINARPGMRNSFTFYADLPRVDGSRAGGGMKRWGRFR